MNRNKTIYKLRNKKKTLKQIGASFNLTQERVRQMLIEKDLEKCIKHDTSYLGFCEYCKEEKSFSELIEKLDLAGLMEIVSFYLKGDREKMIVLKRTLIAKLLRNKFKMTYPKIGKILKRDHSTVIKMCKKD